MNSPSTDETIICPRDAPYRVQLPEQYLGTSLAGHGTVGLELSVESYPRIEVGDAEEASLTRTISPRPSEEGPGLTLPKTLVDAGGYNGAELVPYNTTDGVGLAVNQSTTLTDVTYHARGESVVSVQQGDRHVVKIPQSLVPPAWDPQKQLTIKLDHSKGRLFFVVFSDVDEITGADVTPNPNTGRENTTGLSFYFPGVLAKAIELGAEKIRWGRTADGSRLIGSVAKTQS